MEDVRDLKELQIDALREVANIGAGHAATALSQMTNRRIMISVPRINIARLEEVPDLLGNSRQIVRKFRPSCFACRSHVIPLDLTVVPTTFSIMPARAASAHHPNG